MSELLTRARDWVAEIHPHAQHLLRTEDWVVELEPAASERLRLAAVLHDIERAFPVADSPWDSARDWDSPQYNRWHQDRCASIASEWLLEQQAGDELVVGVRDLIAVHEEGGWPEADLLQAADSLSFLDTMVPLVVGWVQSDRASRARAAAKLQSSLDRIDPSLTHARELAAPMLVAAIETLDAAAVRAAS